MFKTLALALFVGFLLAPASTRADGVDPAAVYNESGSFNLQEGTVCPTCFETIQFSLDLSYSYQSADYGEFQGYNASLLGPISFTSSGPLVIDSAVFTNSPFQDDNQVVEFFDQGGDEVDAQLLNISFEPTPGPPAVGAAYIYECHTTVCDQAFAVNGMVGVIFDGTPVSYTVTAVPEPTSLSLLLIGLLALSGLAVIVQRTRSIVPTNEAVRV